MMTNGVTETTGKLVDALRGQPMTLALLVLTGIFMYLIYSGVSQQRTLTHEVLTALLEQNKQAQELLARCVVPGHTERENDDVPLPVPDPRRADAKLPI
jgi:hypothetical protein